MQPGRDGLSVDSRGQAEIEGRATAESAPDEAPASGAASARPPAGPHDAPDLIDRATTPGAGALPDPTADDEADAATC